MRAGSSSSPNGRRVDSIQADSRGTVRVVISDGSVFIIPEQDYLDLEIVEGYPVTEEMVASLEGSDTFRQAYSKGLDLLTYRDHSVLELRRKLLRRDFSQDAVSRAVSRLREAGYLDDERFSRNWIESRYRKSPEGSVKLLAGLVKKGVSREIAGRAVADLVDPEREEAAFEEACARLSRTGRSKESIARALSRKGFSGSKIIDFLSRRAEDEEQL